MKNARMFLLLSLSLVTMACSDNHMDNIQRSGMIFCSEGNPVTFNPQLDTSGTTVDATSHQLYDRLLDFDPDTSKIIPGLASSWLISDDGLTYTFQLRKNVAFHTTSYFQPSRNFNADDVLFSMNRWRQLDHPFHDVSGGVYPYFASLGLDSQITEVNRINGYRIEIKLAQPDSSFLANLATDFAVILSAEYGEQLMSRGTPELLDSQPIGTGPYQFISYRKDRFIRYTRHQDYWKRSLAPEKLIYDITPQSSMRIAKLMTGECDAIAFPSHSELSVIQERPELVLEEKPGLNVGFWAFNTIKPPFDNPDVRRALAMAIDKDALIEAVYFGSAIKAKSILSPSSWAFDAGIRDTNYNPVRARELLAEAGVPAGFTMNIWAMPVVRAYNPNATKMAELIQGYLAEVGINADIISFEWTTFRRRLQDGLHDSVLIGWSADNTDPDNFYRPLLSCASIFSGTNRANWCSDAYDTAIDQALQVSDEEQRKSYYQIANDILHDEMPLVPIAHAYRYQAYRSNLSGLAINPLGGIRFANVEKH